MKMVKSLLLGAAAGFVAMSGAQAADLPVKAKPVQYVKICSLYGAGFYYIPGTDTCIKIGGFVRTEWNFNANGSFAPYTADTYTRSTLNIRNRSRAIVSIDARDQTEYGTLRSYLRGGWQWTSSDFQVGGSQGGSNVAGTGSPTGAAQNSSSTTYFDRAFIQFAGFTFGKTQSFFDFFNTPGYSQQTNFMWRDTGGSGTPVLAYTAQFGNGLTGTISLEDYTEAQMPIVSLGSASVASPPFLLVPGLTAASIAGSPVGQNAGYNMPDVVANLRVDQPWGSAQIMGAAHDNRAKYYVTGIANETRHPSDVWGFAVGAGITINLPTLGAGDSASFMGTYCSGASAYCSNPGGGILGSGALYSERNSGTVYGVGNVTDAYYNSASLGSLELSKMYSLVGAINHNWNPKWQTSLYSGYVNYQANSNAVDTLACVLLTPAASATPGCLDWSAWQIGSRTIWKPAANLELSVDVMYHKVKSALHGATISTGTVGLPAVGTAGDVGEWAGIFRVQRNFYP